MDDKYEMINAKLDKIISLLTPRRTGSQITMLYFENKSAYDFKDQTTIDAYNLYVDFVKSVDPNETPMTIRNFNSVVKESFPSLTIAHTTKNKKQLYVWR